MNFDGKVAVVTGGGSGIGRATALKFADLGAKVAIVDMDEEGSNNLSRKIKENGGDALVVKTDISKYEEVKEMARKVHDRFGKIDVVVNCAAWDKIQSFMDTTPEFWNKVIDIDLKGTIHVTRALLEYMIKQDTGGAIVNVASDAAKIGSSGEAVYSAAKGGVCSFSKSIAREVVRYNIRVNSTCPSPTDTPFFAQIAESMPKIVEAIKKSIPMRRISTPEEQANAIVWLASDEASFITGQSLSVNGGMSMC
jgi:2-hydroxycyclohexanecarboxyl-CoA dehydrogenase